MREGGRDGGAWGRLERYARFRGRMHLSRLPCDVLDAMVQRHLGPEEVMCLGEAFAGQPLDGGRGVVFVRAMPQWLRQTWLCALATLRAHRLVRQMETEAFWYATLSQRRTRMHIDWSPYATRLAPRSRMRAPPMPLATFEWTHERPHAVMRMDGGVMVEAVRRAIAHRSAVVHVALYADGVWHDEARGNDDVPILAFEHELLPPEAVRATYSSDALSPEGLARAPIPRPKRQIAPRRAVRRALPPPPPPLSSSACAPLAPPPATPSSSPPFLPFPSDNGRNACLEGERRQGAAGMPRRTRRVRRRPGPADPRRARDDAL